jgi:DNA-binding LytR/AlgR family response regulator
MSVRSVEEILPRDVFQRVHRSYIVNLDYVKTVGRMQVVVDSQSIPVSDTYKDELMNRLAER